ncbi:MAG: preprotein translocase subunit SecY, partial [Chloroflexi bacterium]|nr:preprotein translocase subunit SecY [Chloroflexota bacterium]
MIDTLVNAFRTPEIRRKLFFVAGMLIVFRLLSHVPVPGADPAALSDFFKDNALFGLLDLFSGGGLARFSVVGLGLNPYINASIIMQLMSGVVPRL